MSALEEVECWILSWGAHASVVAPVELRKRVVRTARAVASGYENAGM
jgi:predicted DNA-binding transcriptional regulator YafY